VTRKELSGAAEPPVSQSSDACGLTDRQLSETIELAHEWARPYATAHGHEVPGVHPLDCPRQEVSDEMCFECANEALALGVVALATKLGIPAA
jgi:hypothetical protein